MVVYTLEQGWEILRHYFENHGNVAECVRKLRRDFGRREASSAPYVRCLMNKVKETGILVDKPKREKPKEYVQPGILLLWQKVCVKRHQYQQLNISETSLRRIWREDLGITPYKVQLVH